VEISELITIIRVDYLDDTFSGWESASQTEKDDQFLWKDSALLRYLSEAQRQSCNRTDFLFDDETCTVTLVAGSPTYALSNRITRIEQVTFDEKTVLHRSKIQLQMEQPRWRTDTGMTGETTKYTMRGHKIRFYPIPDAIDADKKVYFDTYRLPLEDITATSDDLEIPEEFHKDLIWWVLYEAYSKQDADAYDSKRADRYLAQFENVFGPYIDSKVRIHQLQEDKSASFTGINYLSNSSDSDPDWPD